MGRTLNKLQRGFVIRHVTGKSVNDMAQKDVNHRKQTIQAELAKLDPHNPERLRLEQLVAAADLKTQGPNPDFDAAYDDLEQVKRDAKLAARNYIRDVSPTDATIALSRLENRVKVVADLVAESHAGMKALIDELKAEDLPADSDYDGIVAFRQAVTDKEAIWRAELATCKQFTDQAATIATGLGLKVAISQLRTDVKTLAGSKDKAKQAEAAKLQPRLDTLDQAARINGAYYDNGTIQKPFLAQAAEFDTELKRLQRVQNREAQPATDGRFAALEAREKAVIKQAVTAYSLGRQTDLAVLDPSYTQPARPKPAALPKFRLSDVVPDDLDLQSGLDDQKIAAAAQQAGRAAAAIAQREAQRTPNSDVLFDVTTKTLEQMAQETAAVLGMPKDMKEWTPEQKKLLKAIGQAVRAAAVAVNPNKASATTTQLAHGGQNYDVPSSFAVNGQQYVNPKILGKGGLGLVTRYEGPSVGGQPTSVVIKAATANGERGRADMGMEMQAHRRMMGGEAHTVPPNVVEMKGAAVGADGTLYMIMKEEAGDCDQFGHAVSVMARAGVLPKAAQQAMQQETMLQAAQGLKAMQDNGMLHNDIKPANFLIDADGNVKIADLGSAEAAEQGADRNLQPNTTPAYTADDWFRKRSDKTDTHALGVMLAGMSSDGGIEEKTPLAAFGGYLGPTLRTDKNETSLDRLRNAMIHKDPAKRPTLDGILMSSYLNDARDNYGDPDAGAAAGGSQQAGGRSELTALRKAIAAYVKLAGSRVDKLNANIALLKGNLAKAAQDAEEDPAQLPAFKQLEAAYPAAAAALQKQIDTIHAEPEVAKALDAVRAASQPFGTSTDGGKHRNFAFAYNKNMKIIDMIGTKQPKLPDDLAAEIRSGPDLQPAT